MTDQEKEKGVELGDVSDRGTVRLQWTGDHVYRGADEKMGISLTCDPGDVVEVSKEKAAKLVTDPAWRPYKPKASAASRGVPGAQGEGASTPGGGGGAMHTGSASGKSGGPGGVGGQGKA